MSCLIQNWFKTKIWALFLFGSIAWIIQIAIVYSLSNMWIDTEKTNHINHQINIFTNTIKGITDRHEALAQLSFEADINTPTIQKLMFDASHVDEPKRDIYRKKLLNDLSKKYNAFSANDIRQFQFHLPGSISFLRFHKPSKYGDSLKGIRKTIDTVNQTYQPIKGFEEGRVNNGYRYVFPIFYQKEFVGTVEFGFAHSIISKEIQKLYNAHSELILFKEHIDKTDFKDELHTYKSSQLSDDFYVDNQFDIINNQYSKTLIKTINKDLKPQITPLLKENKPFSSNVRLNQKIFNIYFLPLYSYDKTKAGYIVIYNESQTLALMDRSFWEMFWIGTLAVTLVTIILFWLFYRLATYQMQLQEINKTLENKVSIEVEKNIKQALILHDKSKLSAMGAMIGNIIHQWKQPLHYISAISETILFKASLKERSEFNDFIIGEMNDINMVIDRLDGTLLTFRNFLKEKKERKLINLQESIDVALVIVSAVLKDHHIVLNNNIHNQEAIFINTISPELSEVIINIVNNAKDVLIEKQIEDPWINVDISKKETIVIITIEDNGGGIPKEIMPNIFDEYFTTKSETNGTGLGLHMARMIVEESLGGKIYAQNSANGATFFIELPLE